MKDSETVKEIIGVEDSEKGMKEDSEKGMKDDSKIVVGVDLVEKTVEEICLDQRLHKEAEHLKRIKCTKFLRIYLKMNLNPEFTLRIDSRVLNDFKNNQELKMSDLLKRFLVVLDDTEILEWTKTGEVVEAFEMRGSTPHKSVKILFDFENPREIFKLSPILRKILERHTETKPNVITGLWKYIHLNKLVEIGGEEICCNGDLVELFGRERLTMYDIPSLVVPHLCPLDILEVSLPLEETEDIFEIPIELDDLCHFPRIYNKEVYAVERRMEFVEQVKERCKNRHQVLEEYYNNPVGYINKWVCLDSLDGKTKTPLFVDRKVQEEMFKLLKKLEQ